MQEQHEDTFPHLALEPLAQRLPVVDVLRLARVSRAWREYLGRRLLTEPLRLECGTEQRCTSAVAWLGKNLTRTRDLELRGWCAQIPPDLLARAATNSLVRLSFSGPFSAAQLPSLAACTALRELEIVDCNGITELPPLDALSQLTLLQVSGCSHLAQLPSSVSSCTALQVLRVYSNRKLRSLHSSLASCTALEALTIASRDYNSFELPQAVLPALTRLTRLDLYGCNVKALSFSTFPQLRALHISWCDVTASQLDTLTACMQLSELHVVGCCGDQDGAGCLGAHLPPLTALHLLSDLNLGIYEDSSRFPSLAGLTRLTYLCVSYCDVEPFQLAPISGLTSLVHLNVLDCSVVELPSLVACKQLQVLNVAGCSNLAALPDLAGCTRLSRLYFKGCESLQVLPNLSSCITALKILSLSTSTALLEAPGFDEWLEWLEWLRHHGVHVSLCDDDFDDAMTSDDE